MKARVDRDRCSGHAMCNKEAPELFELDDDGYNVLRGKEAECPPDQEEAAERGAAVCPERAIRIQR
jgi:ferredoxin